MIGRTFFFFFFLLLELYICFCNRKQKQQMRETKDGKVSRLSRRGREDKFRTMAVQSQLQRQTEYVPSSTVTPSLQSHLFHALCLHTMVSDWRAGKKRVKKKWLVLWRQHKSYVPLSFLSTINQVHSIKKRLVEFTGMIDYDRGYFFFCAKFASGTTY